MEQPRSELDASLAPHPWFRAVAVDYDGTLTDNEMPSAVVLRALHDARRAGFRLILVTGRILTELRAVFPGVDQWFDAIVAENGAVLVQRGTERPLARPVDPRLLSVLLGWGAEARQGQVIVATRATHGPRLTDLIHTLGLDYQLLYNRGELMVLPSSVSKGAGLLEALGNLGLSAHECIGIGDAENDHTLLETCEVGVAVGNAVPALKHRADVVLDQSAGEGVVAFLDKLRCPEGWELLPLRRSLYLGTADDGAPVQIPATHVNVLIRGPSGSGKSYLAGLLAERVLRLDYSLCLIDPEGDHAHLGKQPRVLHVGEGSSLVPVAMVRELLAKRLSSVVVDLCQVPYEARMPYVQELLSELFELRRRTGLPHWLIVDEAHLPFSEGDRPYELEQDRTAALCVVTYRPEWMRAGVMADIDFVIDTLREGRSRIRRGHAPPIEFRPAMRELPHQRHLGKYLHGTCPRALGFWFRTREGNTGALARNLRDFGVEVGRAPDASLRHHLARGDFSRWVRDVFRDADLADAIASIERVNATP
ncbi:MAG: HAD hydrolase family protein, partial [Myxococcota bacterium]